MQPSYCHDDAPAQASSSTNIIIMMATPELQQPSPKVPPGSAKKTKKFDIKLCEQQQG
jgi:hypothetical protein